jgi:hypothetical protein
LSPARIRRRPIPRATLLGLMGCCVVVQVRILEKVDWQTRVLMEHNVMPWPLADREDVYWETWQQVGAQLFSCSVIRLIRALSGHG